MCQDIFTYISLFSLYFIVDMFYVMCYIMCMDTIKDIKARRQISNEQIAREIGVSWSTVQRWLSGQFHPSHHVMPLVIKWIDKNK